MTGKTIIYLPNWLGDMVMATPFLHALRQSREGQLWAVGKPPAIQLYHGLDLFDRFIPFEGKGVVPFLDLVSLVRAVPFDGGIVLPHSFRSALLFFLGSVQGRIGYNRNRRGFMLSSTVEEPPDPLVPTVEHYLRMLGKLGAARTLESPRLCVTDDEERRYDERFTEVSGAYVAFIVGAQYGSSKRWPETSFSRLADLLAERFDLRVYLLPGKGEETLARRILDGVTHKDRVEVRLMEVRELKVCLSRAAATVSNDTGPRHVSAALSVPTVVILGPMDERYTAYASDFTHTMGKEMACRPCNKRRCDRDHACMKEISPEEVARKVGEVLKWPSDRS